MSNYQIAVIIGSLSKVSVNRRLAAAIEKLAPSEFTFKQLQISDLPLYNYDDDSNPAESAKRLKSEIKSSHGLMFVTPEYNRSMPAALKNALDHGSRPYGQSAWAGKPAGILGASSGAIGTAVAQQQLRNVLAFLDVPTLGQPEAFITIKDGFFDEAGNVANQNTKIFLQGWMDRYVAWILKHAA